MNGLGILVKNQLAIYVWVYIQILSSIQLVYISIHGVYVYSIGVYVYSIGVYVYVVVSGPHGFDYCSSVVF